MQERREMDWKTRAPGIFKRVRRDFGLEDKVGLGTFGHWHQGVSSGTILPMRSKMTKGRLVWETPYIITSGLRVDEYRAAELTEKLVLPRTNRSEVNAFNILISPAPGLEEPFKTIPNKALTGLIAHELAECELAARNPTFHDRMTHHRLPEKEVDKIACDRGYGDQVKAHLQFLLSHVEKIKPRKPPVDSLSHILTAIGGQVLTIGQAPQYTREAMQAELLERIKAIEERTKK
ncbi:MAG: hypothetical protein V1722_03215 [Candidatus Micrarchaeota archaeon]